MSSRGEGRAISVLFISHDLAVLAELCDRLAIMREGRIVEQGPATTVLSEPVHPYTRDLVRAVPRVGVGLGGGSGGGAG